MFNHSMDVVAAFEPFRNWAVPAPFEHIKQISVCMVTFSLLQTAAHFISLCMLLSKGKLKIMSFVLTDTRIHNGSESALATV